MFSGCQNVIYILYGRVNPHCDTACETESSVRSHSSSWAALFSMCPAVWHPPWVLLVTCPSLVDVGLGAQRRTKGALGWLTDRQDGGGSAVCQMQVVIHRSLKFE